MKRIRLLRSIAAAVAAAGTLIAIAAYGGGVEVGLVTAPAGAIASFAAAWLIQRWRLGGTTGQQVAVVLTTVLLMATVVAMILNRGAVGPSDIASGVGLFAIGAFAFWPAVVVGVIAYVVADRLLVSVGHRG